MISASDLVYASSALMETDSPTSSPVDLSMKTNTNNEQTVTEETKDNKDGISYSFKMFTGFNEAYDCLGLRNDELLKRGLQSAISLQKVCAK
jgi:hypothetical protein